MTYLAYLMCFLNLIVDSLLVCFIVLDCELNFSEFYLETPVRLGLRKSLFLSACAFISAQMPQRVFSPWATFMLISLLRASWIIWAT